MRINSALLISTLVALVGFVILIRLGFWQISRAEEKQARLTDIETLQAQPAVSTNDNFNELADFQKVELEGFFLVNRFFWLDNRVINGQVGYEAIVPLKTQNNVVLVNLGWKKTPELRTALPTLNLPKSKQQLITTIYPFNRNPFIKNIEEDEGWPKRIQQIDYQALGEMLNTELSPHLFYLHHSEQFQLTHNWQPVSLSPERHYAYAVQWFGLAIALVVVFYFAAKDQHLLLTFKRMYNAK